MVLGNTNGSVIDSYGNSPVTGNDNGAWIVRSGGNVGGYYNIGSSYGVDIAEHT